MSVYAIEPFLTSVFTLSQVTGTNFPYKLHLNFVENFGFLSILTAFFFSLLTLQRFSCCFLKFP